MEINLDKIPLLPGVYIMQKGDKVIYVGKAKLLKNRVASYFNRNLTDSKSIELVKNIEKIDFIVTNSESDALILENNLIKKYKPKYNILLKDEKTYPYIYISNEKYPKIQIIRNTKKSEYSSGEFFGPFPLSVYGFIKLLKKLFSVRDCNRDMDKIYSRPCLKYYMKMCLGPCVYKECYKEYSINVESIKKVLKGEINSLIKEFQVKMKESSENMEYEKAIIYRNRIEEIKKISNTQVCEYSKGVDEDIIVYQEYKEQIFVVILSIREGKVLEKISIKSDKKFEDDEYFERIFTMYYEEKKIPDKIVIQEKFSEKSELIKSWCKEAKKKTVEIYIPIIKSRRKELLEMAEKNLEEDIKRVMESDYKLNIGVQRLKDILGLNKLPVRIECFDISNIQGKDAVGSMSVAINGKTIPKEYRRFKIKTKDTPDDFEMMREVLKRRYSKLSIEEMPELILIDGGKGQLSAAEEILKIEGKFEHTTLISIAKKEELVFKAGEEIPFVISDKEESLKILQRLRDEAHRFGIMYHRKLRSKRVIRSEIDNIMGIGEKRRAALLQRFGSVSGIKKASLDELKEILPENIALKIVELKEGREH